MSAGRGFLAVAVLALTVACSPDTPENEAAANDALQSAESATLGEQAGDQSDGQQGADPALNGEDIPTDFARTAWRIEDSDGARYTTYLDDGGRYRDFRNGDLWHVGSWEVDDEGRLCLSPEQDAAGRESGADDAQGSQTSFCWTPRGMDGDGGMIIKASSGKRVRLQQVDYEAPESAPSGQDAGDAGSAPSSGTGPEASAPA